MNRLRQFLDRAVAWWHGNLLARAIACELAADGMRARAQHFAHAGNFPRAARLQSNADALMRRAMRLRERVG